MDTKKLRKKILDLAIRGKLVPQDSNDEPASVLIEKIRAKKEQLIKEKKIKRDKNESHIYRSDKSYYEKFADGTVKCIDEEIPFEIPESWEWTRLGNLCDYGICTNVSPTAIPDDAWILDLEDIEKDTARLLQRVCKANRKTTSSRHSFSKGNVLYSKLRTYLNKVLVADMDGFSTTEILPLDFKGFVVSEYAQHVLMSKMFLDYTAQCGYGVKMPRLGTTDGKKALFPLPPYSEQECIVKKIQILLSVIDSLEENKEDLNQFITQTKSKILDLAIRGKLVPQDPNDEPASVLLERIKAERPEIKKKLKSTGDNSHYENLEWVVPSNWCWCLLSDICFFERGITFPSSAKKTFKVEYLIPCIRTANVQEQLELEDLWYIDPIYIKNNKNKLVRNGDIIMSSANSRELVGKTSYVQNIDLDMTFGGFVLNIRANKIDSKYLFYLLRCYFDKGIFMTESTQTTNIANINSTILGNLKIPLPPLKEQIRIIYQIESIFNELENIAEL